MIYNTADISDADPTSAHYCDIDFRQYGHKHKFCGPCVTLKVHEDHRIAAQLFNTQGDGRVLIIDGGGLRRIALLGATMAAKAVQNGWAGAVVYGAIRDSEELATINLGIKAVCTTVLKSAGPTEHQLNIPVQFGGVTFHPGDWVYADSDGIIVRKAAYISPEVKTDPSEKYR